MDKDIITYSRMKPKRRGHYWFRNEYGQDFIARVHLFGGDDELHAFINGNWNPVSRLKGQFAKAPLPEPEPANKKASAN